ncbi:MULTISPECIES: response regulator [unclassified Frankia]|uniref:response regulator n=1 Tax=unclassified Frankia TaxID=2632575 RepID=UPI001EE4125D|nr:MULTISPECIES: adenylate/guanylate cyclase domain-containing protein [unclassified Frankia]
MEPITVLLADDNLIAREGIRALLATDPAVRVVAVAADRDELVRTAFELHPQVVVTDIRMPPTFQDDGIAGAKEVRRRHPGTGVVVLSQFDDPEYAIALLADGAAGFAYLLKDQVGEPGRLSRAIREVATGGSMLDPQIVAAMLSPVTQRGELSAGQEELLAAVAAGRPVKAIAATRRQTPEAVNGEIEEIFLRLAEGASAGRRGALRRLRLLHTALLRREEQGETLSRLLPSGLAEKLSADAGAAGRTERLEVTVLISDVRGYSAIAERADPAALAGQLGAHRREMNAAILGHGGTVMQYVGDAVMAVFGAPFTRPDHALLACRAAGVMHARQARLDEAWAADGLAPFGLGIGVCSGPVAAALLGSEERLEYTLVGDTVNLAQRLGDLARPAGTTVISDATATALGDHHDFDVWEMPARTVKGRTAQVRPFQLWPRTAPAADGTTDEETSAADQGPTPARAPRVSQSAPLASVSVEILPPVGEPADPGPAPLLSREYAERGRRWWQARGRARAEGA